MNIETWVTLKEAGRFNEKAFSFITSTNQCVLKYDILEMGYILEVKLYWFTFSWRRRENEVIDVLSSLVKLPISEKEIHKIPLFEKLIKSGKNNKELLEYINNDHEIKKALIERYSKKIGECVYNDNNSNDVVIIEERFSSKVNFEREFCKKYAKSGVKSEIIDIEECIIDAY